MTDQTFDITHKRGTTFSYVGPGSLPTGTWSARSQIRAAAGGRLLATLTCTLTPTDGLPNGDTHVLTVASNDDTAGWAPGSYVMDVKFTSSAEKVATQTLKVRVIDRVTEDG